MEYKDIIKGINKHEEAIINNELTNKALQSDIDKRNLLFKGSYKDLKDLLENNSEVTEKGGVIYLPSGIFEIEPFEIGSRIKIKGSGIGATILRYKANSESDFITITTADNFSSIEDLTIDGNKSNGTLGNCVHVCDKDTWNYHDPELILKKDLKQEDSNSYFFMNNVTIINAPTNGIKLEQKRYAINFNNIYINYANLNGIHNRSTDNFFNNIWCNNCGHSGLLEEGKNNKWNIGKIIFNNQSNDIDGAIQISGNNNTFIGFESQDNYSHGFRITGGGNTLIGCLADVNGYKTYDISTEKHDGFRLENCYFNTLRGCEVANYREKVFTNKPYNVIGGGYNDIDVTVLLNSCLSNPEGNKSIGTYNYDNVKMKYLIDKNVKTIFIRAYFDITTYNLQTQTIDLPFQFTDYLSISSEVVGINCGSSTVSTMQDKHLDVYSNAFVIEESGVKKVKVQTKHNSSIDGIWSVVISIRLDVI